MPEYSPIQQVDNTVPVNHEEQNTSDYKTRREVIGVTLQTSPALVWFLAFTLLIGPESLIGFLMYPTPLSSWAGKTHAMRNEIRRVEKMACHAVLKTFCSR
jgi:hypothetical protein